MNVCHSWYSHGLLATVWVIDMQLEVLLFVGCTLQPAQ
jgi:hypothetical protein